LEESFSGKLEVNRGRGVAGKASERWIRSQHHLIMRKFKTGPSSLVSDGDEAWVSEERLRKFGQGFRRNSRHGARPATIGLGIQDRLGTTTDRQPSYVGVGNSGLDEEVVASGQPSDKAPSFQRRPNRGIAEDLAGYPLRLSMFERHHERDGGGNEDSCARSYQAQRVDLFLLDCESRRQFLFHLSKRWQFERSFLGVDLGFF
jgi:hypothetical protein